MEHLLVARGFSPWGFAGIGMGRMPVLRVILAMLVVMFVGARALAADGFLDQVDLEPLKMLSVQDNSTLKTLDSFARQRLSAIAGKSSLDGQGSLAVVLDMTFRPEAYRDRNVIKIKNVPLRQDFGDFGGIDAAEKNRISHRAAAVLKLRDFLQARESR